MEYNSKTKVIYGGERTQKYPKSMGFGEILIESFRTHRNKVAIIDGNTEDKLTFHDILKEVTIFSAIYKNFNLQPGNIIGIITSNRLNYWIPGISGFINGLITAPINYSFKSNELIAAISITKPKIVFCTTQTQDSLLKISKECPFLEKLIVFDGSKNETINGIEIYSYCDLKERFKDVTDLEIYPVNPKEDAAVIMHSSGTTGLPKGVMLTHYNFVAVLEMFHLTKDVKTLQNGTELIFLPVFHVYGMGTVLNYLASGITFIILSGFKETKIFELVQKYRISRLLIVPPVAVILTKSKIIQNYDLSSLKSINIAAAPLSKSVEEQLKQNFKRDLFITQSYGLTESTLGVIGLPLDVRQRKPGSIGRVLIGNYVKVINPENLQALGPYEHGEICLKGDMITKGYYQNPKVTEQTIDPDGWLRTGDIGYYDDDLNFFIVDRSKELIKYKGFQVAPAELEGLLLQHNDVLDAAVIGVEDDECGELPKAFIVKKSNSKITNDDIEKYVQEKVSSHKWLRGGVVFIDKIPKNSTGKILRRKLKTLIKLRSLL